MGKVYAVILLAIIILPIVVEASYIGYDNIYTDITAYPGYIYVNETSLVFDREYHMDDFDTWNASQYVQLNVKSITELDGVIKIAGARYRTVYGIRPVMEFTPPFSVEVRYYMNYGVKEPRVKISLPGKYDIVISGGYTNGFLPFRIVLINYTTNTSTLLAKGTMYSKNYVWYTLHVDVYENGTIVTTLSSSTSSETLRVNLSISITKHHVWFQIFDDRAPRYGGRLDLFYVHRNVVDVVMPQGKQVIIKTDNVIYNLIDWDLDGKERIEIQQPLSISELILASPLGITRAYTKHDVTISIKGEHIDTYTTVLNITGDVNITSGLYLTISLGNNSSIFLRSEIPIDLNRLENVDVNITKITTVGIELSAGAVVAMYEKIMIYDNGTLVYNETFTTVNTSIMISPPIQLKTHSQAIVIEIYAETNTSSNAIVEVYPFIFIVHGEKSDVVYFGLPSDNRVPAYSLIDLYKNNTYVEDYEVTITFFGKPDVIENITYMLSPNETENYEGWKVISSTTNNTSITIKLATTPIPTIIPVPPGAIALSPYLDFLLRYNNTLEVVVKYKKVLVGDNLVVKSNKAFNITVLYNKTVYDTEANVKVYNKTYYGVGRYFVEALRLLDNETGVAYEYVTVDFGKPIFVLNPVPPVVVKGRLIDVETNMSLVSSGTQLAFDDVEKGTYTLTISMHGIPIYKATYEFTSENAWNTFVVNLNGYTLTAYNGYKYAVAATGAPTIYVKENRPDIPFSNITIYTSTPSNVTLILVYENPPDKILASPETEITKIDENVFLVKFDTKTTLVDMYTLRVELRDRLGRMLPEQGFSINGKVYGIEELLPADYYNVSVPQVVEGFKFYKWGDNKYNVFRMVTLTERTTLVAEYLVPTRISFNVTFLNTTPEYFIKAIKGVVPALIEGHVLDYFSQPVPFRNVTIEVYINDYLYIVTETRTDGSGYFSIYLDLPYVTSPDKLKIIARTSQDTVYLPASTEKVITVEEIGVTPIQIATLLIISLVAIGIVTTLAYHLRKKRSM